MFGRLLSVGGFTLLSRVMGFLRSIVTAAVLGDGMLSDTFMVALRLPNSFRNIFAEGAFNASFVPRYAGLRATEGETSAAVFADRIFSWQMAAQAILLMLAMVGMPWLVRIMAPGFAARPGEAALAVSLSRITFPYLILTVVAVQISAMLNARERFWAAAAWPVLLNLGIIGALLVAWLFPNAGYAAAWGVLIAGFLQLLFIVWAGLRDHVHLRLGRLVWSPRIREFMLALAAGTLGSGSVQIGLFVDTMIASYLPPGVLTAVTYADNIDQLPLGTIGIALATILLPEMSARLARGDVEGAQGAQNDAAILTLFLTLPFVAAFLLVPQTIMRAIYAHGHFPVAAADISARALSAYGLGLPAFVLLRVLQATFYARHDTATPARGTVLAVLVNVAMKLVLVFGLHLGAYGVALGTSLGTWVNVIFLYGLGRRRDFLHVNAKFARALPVVLLAAVATGFAALGASLMTERYLGSAHFARELRLACAILFEIGRASCRERV